MGMKRRYNWDEIVTEYKTGKVSMYALAKKHKTDISHIRYILKKSGIKIVMIPRSLNTHPLRVKVRKLKAKGLTYAEIGNEMGFSRQYVQYLVAPADSELKALNLNHEQCELCGTRNVRLHAHHSNYNEPPDMILCTSCHSKITSNVSYKLSIRVQSFTKVLIQRLIREELYGDAGAVVDAAMRYFRKRLKP